MASKDMCDETTGILSSIDRLEEMASKDLCNETTCILDLIDRLEGMAKPVPNDRRQKKYCKYISLFLSHFGQERCMVAGSTNEKTRLRLNGDEGDFDYLIISGISIPIECLEYKKNLPCFVYVNGSTLKTLFKGVQLIDGKYLPSDLLSEIKPEAFKHSRNIHKIVTQMDSTRGRDTLRVSIDHKIKPGLSLVHYSNPKCPELSMEQNKQKKDTGQIKQNIEKNLEGDSDESKKMMYSGAKALSSIVEGWEILNKSRDTEKTIFHQTYDPLIKAINCEDTLHQACPSNPKKPRLESSNDLSTYNDLPSTSGVSGKLNNESQGDEHTSVNDVDDQVTIQYSYKTSKDFIPVFPLKGKPEYLDKWQNRKRNWPPTNVVTDIYNSEFFVVAKPALVEPSKDIDFCLACNIGEIKLAKAMTQLQRNVILIIKALQKSALRNYTEILTTFHWKTAVYWVSEKTETQILEHRTEDNVLKFLRNVLEYMVNCLCKNDLQHYFVPSNLFVGIHKDDIHKIVPKIVEIKKNPMENLKNFAKEQSTDQVHFDIVPRSKIREFQKMHYDPGDNVVVESVVSLIRGFFTENKEVMKKALKKVLTDAVPFLIEETKDSNSQIIQALSRTDSLKSNVIDVAVSWLLDEMHNTKAPKVEDCKRNMFALVMKKFLTGNLF
ncbi:Hypothetical predicted protein [Mytilus galloprovincialis]|uniref:Mab-21-like HhH/H2TH-like domain-containing protein n=1 Tax=Mytilus galloprovincialis TaxID=29158 RepID=A0A8B6GWJ4_MYTGA|nr:Hypothetical predicted protein [Mytilus galloprovincialis]